MIGLLWCTFWPIPVHGHALWTLAAFERLMECVLQNLLWSLCLVYLHGWHNIVLLRLILTINLASVTFLIHLCLSWDMFVREGLQCDMSKITEV